MPKPEDTKQRRLIRWPVAASLLLTTLIIIASNLTDFYPSRPFTQLVFLGEVLLAFITMLFVLAWIICAAVCLFRRCFLGAVSFLTAIIAIPAVGFAEVRLDVFDLYLWQVLLDGRRLAAFAHEGAPQGGPVCSIIYARDVSVGIVGGLNVFTRLVFDDRDEMGRAAGDRTTEWRERCAALTDDSDDGGHMSLAVTHLHGHFYLVHLFE